LLSLKIVQHQTHRCDIFDMEFKPRHADAVPPSRKGSVIGRHENQDFTAIPRFRSVVSGATVFQRACTRLKNAFSAAKAATPRFRAVPITRF
jgi:hypothetical protein